MHIIRYPIDASGGLPRLEKITEYQIITPRGAIVSTYEDKDLAIKRWSESPASFKLLEVTRSYREITPKSENMKLVEAA